MQGYKENGNNGSVRDYFRDVFDHLTRINAKLVAEGHPGLRNVRGRGYAVRVEGQRPTEG